MRVLIIVLWKNAIRWFCFNHHLWSSIIFRAILPSPHAVFHWIEQRFWPRNGHFHHPTQLPTTVHPLGLVDGRMRWRPVPNQGQSRQSPRCGFQASRCLKASRQRLCQYLQETLRFHHRRWHLRPRPLTGAQVRVGVKVRVRVMERVRVRIRDGVRVRLRANTLSILPTP